MNKIQIEDFEALCQLGYIHWEKLNHKTILITGSTGLIGSNLALALLYANKSLGLNMHLVLPARNTEAAHRMFGEEALTILPYSVGDELHYQGSVDYLVHLASPTSSKFFAEKPVNTMLTNIEGTKTILDFAASKQIKKLVCLSTMEVYGLPEKGHKVQENELGSFDTMSARNSYPIAKIACEALCHSYYKQYGLPAVILRLTQTFGPGVRYDDGRVFAQFMRCAIEKKDIVLKSAGLTERPYLYTADAVSAIIVALLHGKPGEAYTAANPDTYCSIAAMANLICNEITKGQIKVVFDMEEDIAKLGYADTLYMDLDVSKIEALGWKARTDLCSAYRRMIAWCEDKEKQSI